MDSLLDFSYNAYCLYYQRKALSLYTPNMSTPSFRKCGTFPTTKYVTLQYRRSLQTTKKWAPATVMRLRFLEWMIWFLITL